MPSALKGKFAGPDHYVDPSAKKAYRNGGLFNIDEIDFGEPDVLGRSTTRSPTVSGTAM